MNLLLVWENAMFSALFLMLWLALTGSRCYVRTQGPSTVWSSSNVWVFLLFPVRQRRYFVGGAMSCGRAACAEEPLLLGSQHYMQTTAPSSLEHVHTRLSQLMLSTVDYRQYKRTHGCAVSICLCLLLLSLWLFYLLCCFFASWFHDFCPSWSSLTADRLTLFPFVYCLRLSNKHTLILHCNLSHLACMTGCVCPGWLSKFHVAGI